MVPATDVTQRQCARLQDRSAQPLKGAAMRFRRRSRGRGRFRRSRGFGRRGRSRRRVGRRALVIGQRF